MGSIELDEHDMRLLLDAAWHADGLSDRDDVPQLLAVVSRLVRCDVLFWDWYRTGPTLVELALVDAVTTVPVWRAPLDGWQQNLPHHPIISAGTVRSWP